jgi:hypothetical protein
MMLHGLLHGSNVPADGTVRANFGRMKGGLTIIQGEIIFSHAGRASSYEWFLRMIRVHFWRNIERAISCVSQDVKDTGTRYSVLIATYEIPERWMVIIYYEGGIVYFVIEPVAMATDSVVRPSIDEVYAYKPSSYRFLSGTLFYVMVVVTSMVHDMWIVR